MTNGIYRYLEMLQSVIIICEVHLQATLNMLVVVSLVRRVFVTNLSQFLNSRIRC